MDTVRTTVKVLDRESVNKHDVVTTADIAADSLLLLDMVCQLFCKHYQINLPLPSQYCWHFLSSIGDLNLQSRDL